MATPDSQPKHRLVGDSDILDAALWRLSDWERDDVGAGVESVGRLLVHCPDLNADHPTVYQLLTTMHRPGDRRDGWAALCALAVLWADAHGDQALYFRAGFEVLASYQQAKRGQNVPKPDALDDLITNYLRRHPATTAKQLWEHCTGLARHRMVVEVTGESCLTYRVDQADSKLKTVKWRAFEVRVSRIRNRKVAVMPPAANHTEGSGAFWWPNLKHPAVVSWAG